jgi:type IV pilus assembly protein PilW
MEVMISIVIGMLLVLVIYQVYEVSEGQKRTITGGSDAQQNASYGLYVLGRDISMAGNGIASSASVLDTCALLRPIPVLIGAGGDGVTPNGDVPDTVTVFYGGSSSLSTPTPFRAPATTGGPYVVAGPVGFSPNDVIAAINPAAPPPGICTLSVVTGVSGLPNPNGEAMLAQTPFPGSAAATYSPGSDVVINLGPAGAMGRIVYTVDPTAHDATGHVLRTQNLLSTTVPPPPPVPVVNDVVILKAQYGIDTNNDGSIDAWQDAVGPVWSAANLPAQPLTTLQQIRAVRLAIVTRSTQYERDPITAGSPPGMPDGKIGMFCDSALTCAYTMTLSAAEQHYRYRVLETSIPLRNALWN